MLFYLIYISIATTHMSEAALMALLRQSQRHNQELGITGMLLYKGNQFMQMLEGDRETVLQLFDTIRLDARHTDVVVLEQAPLPARHFAAWSMGFVDMDKVDGLPDYDQYLSQLTHSGRFEDIAGGAYDLLVTFGRMYR